MPGGQVLHAIASTFGRQLLSALFGLIASAAIARACGPAGNGSLAIALLLPTTLAMVMSLGLESASIYQIGSRGVEPRDVLRIGLAIQWIATLLGTTFGVITIALGANAWFPGINRTVLGIAMLIFPLSLLASFLLSVVQALHAFRFYNLLLLGQSILGAFLVLVLWAAGLSDVVYLVCATAICQLATCIFAWRRLRSVTSLTSVARNCCEGELFRALLRYGLPAHVSNIIAFINYRMGLFISNQYLGIEAAGFYSVAASLVDRISLIPQATSAVLLPYLAKLSNDPMRLKALTPVIARWVLAVTTVVALGVAAVSGLIVHFLYGESFVAAKAPLLIMLPGFVVASSSQLLANDIAARGRPGLNLTTSLAALLINCIFNVLLVPRLGICGAALATTFSLAVNMLLKLELYRRLSGNRWLSCLVIQSEDFTLLSRLIRNKLTGLR